MFYEANKLTEVLLPEGLTEIVKGAFAYCESIRHMVIPSTVESIADDVFDGCSSLKVVDLSRCTKLKNLPDKDGDECYGAENVKILFPGSQPLVVPHKQTNETDDDNDDDQPNDIIVVLKNTVISLCLKLIKWMESKLNDVKNKQQ